MDREIPAPPVGGIFETALYVEDMARSRDFYCDLFGFRVITAGARLTALSINDRQILLLFTKGASRNPTTTERGEIIPPTDADGELHLALSIDANSWADWTRRLTERNIEIESIVHWDGGGRSLYFRDPDRHVIELATPGLWPGVEP